MTHDTNYVDTLPSEKQKREFVTTKGNGSHISLLRLLRSGLTVAQVERYVEDEVREHWENKSHIMPELRTIVSNHSLAVDHQRKIVKRPLVVT